METIRPLSRVIHVGPWKRVLVLAIASLIVAACSEDDPVSPPGPMAGTWSGRVVRLATDVTLALSQNEGTAVTGTGSLRGSGITGGAVSVTVSGTCTYPAFSLELSAQGFIPSFLNGTLVTGDSADATLDWSGFIREDLKLKRQ